MIKYTHKEFKTILNKRKFIDSWFWDHMYWAGMNIQNLKESIAAVAARNELRAIRNVTDEILPFIWKNI